jgi:hypothetical protein
MLIYEFQGVVWVDGPVLASSEFHFGNELRISLETKLKIVMSEPEPFLQKPQKRFGTPRVSIVPKLNTGAARKRSLPATLEIEKWRASGCDEVPSLGPDIVFRSKGHSESSAILEYNY